MVITKIFQHLSCIKPVRYGFFIFCNFQLLTPSMTKHILSFLGVVFSLSAAHGAVCIVDLGIRKSGDLPSYSQNGSWAGTGTHLWDDLKDTDGISSGWSFSVTNLRGEVAYVQESKWQAGAPLFDGFSKDVLGLDGRLAGQIWQDSNNLGSSSGTASMLTFSGLLAGETYAVSLGIGRLDAGSATTFNLQAGTFVDGYSFMGNSADKTVIENGTSSITTGSNNPGVAVFYVQADDEGKIAISGWGQYQGLAFASIGSVPEPASASLGLLGLGMLMMRRRRR